MTKDDEMTPAEKPYDMYAERQKWLDDGTKRWLELTKDWSNEDRQWAEKFLSDAAQPWG